VKLAEQITLAQWKSIPDADGRQFRPLEQLENIPPAPPGFEVKVITDGRAYAFSVKDTRDPCRYAIFSDEDRWIYETTPAANEGTTSTSAPTSTAPMPPIRASVTGRWILTQTPLDPGRQLTLECDLREDEKKLTGTVGAAPLVGTVDDDVLAWEVPIHFDGHTATLLYEGRFDANGASVVGTWTCPKHCENAFYKKGTFVLTRKAK
jgi:hypothetical protein